MAQQEYMNERERRHRAITGPGGTDYHQWDNISGELAPVQQAPRDMRSVPRSSNPEGQHSLGPGSRDPWGYHSLSPGSREPWGYHSLSPGSREPWGYHSLSPASRDPWADHSLSPESKEPWGYKQDGQPVPALGFNGSGSPVMDNSVTATVSHEKSQMNFASGNTDRGQVSSYTLGSKSPSSRGFNSSQKESSYPARGHAFPQETTVAGCGRNQRVMNVDGNDSFTLRFSDPPQDNGSGPQNITADHLISSLALTKDYRSPTAYDRDVNRKSGPTSPSSEDLGAGSSGYRESGDGICHLGVSGERGTETDKVFGKGTE